MHPPPGDFWRFFPPAEPLPNEALLAWGPGGPRLVTPATPAGYGALDMVAMERFGITHWARIPPPPEIVEAEIIDV